MEDRQEIEKAGRENGWTIGTANRIDVYSKDDKKMLVVCIFDIQSYFENAYFFESTRLKAGTFDPVVARNWLRDF